MSEFIVTLDIDWASEVAIEMTLEFFKKAKICTTVFITHFSPYITANMKEFDVGLHPFFGENSSHGKTIDDVVAHITSLPHNIPAFRAHRFGVCNSSMQAMQEAGMLLSSNVCTDLVAIEPFTNRFGMTELPVFLEDGGYLWREHSLKVGPILKKKLISKGAKVLLIHPMHFVLNTPHFGFMQEIKKRLSRKAWKNLEEIDLKRLKYSGWGVRDFILELLQEAEQFSFLKSHTLRQRSLQLQN
ncbi:MAG: hypothetical protein SNF33_04260 [Candidatus Algichlamydia australiensis]|nr:hypothetical protein [Chlamydiales bacterium]